MPTALDYCHPDLQRADRSRLPVVALLLLLLSIFMSACVGFGWFEPYSLYFGIPCSALASLVLCCCSRPAALLDLVVVSLVGGVSISILLVWAAITLVIATFSFVPAG